MTPKHKRAFGVQEPIWHFWSAERHSKRAKFSFVGLSPNDLQVMIRHTFFDLFTKRMHPNSHPNRPCLFFRVFWPL